MTKSEKKESILIVDDNPDMLELIKRNLTPKGYKVFTSPGVYEATKVLDSTMIDLVITDIKMPNISGLNLVRHVRENFKNTEVLVITGYPSVEGAVKAVKMGAEEYLIKTFTDNELFSAVQKSFEKLYTRRIAQVRSHYTLNTPYGIIGESKAMEKVFNTIAKTTSTPATVVITGESGTGKELVARAIHYNSPRASAPFVPVNCGAIPDQLLESELFGYLKGAFTGANETRAGFFQTADGGTIFLDEISNTSLSMQAKLLRVLQDKEVYMVGSKKPFKVNIRIIAATNTDLVTLIKKETFREDLYYRLNVMTIHIPPLREREDDILLLIRHFADVFSKEAGKSIPSFSENALHILKNYHWPGNVREVENIIHRLVIMNDGDIIDVPDLPSVMRFSALQKKGFDRTLQEVETEYIQNVLASVNGNKSKAAGILGIDRKTLRDKLNKGSG